VEAAVGRHDVVRPVDGAGELGQLGQLGRCHPRRRHLRRLTGQGGQDGEVVHCVLRCDAHDRDAAAGCDGDETLVGQLQQRLPERCPADAELRAQPLEVQAVAGPQPAGEDPVAELAGRLGPDGGADQFDI
jgi:hypothetical protein